MPVQVLDTWLGSSFSIFVIFKRSPRTCFYACVTNWQTEVQRNHFPIGVKFQTQVCLISYKYTIEFIWPKKKALATWENGVNFIFSQSKCFLFPFIEYNLPFVFWVTFNLII